MVALDGYTIARLDELENKIEQVDLKSVQHDNFAHNTRLQLKQIFEVIRELMEPPEPTRKRPTGFVTLEEKPSKPIAAKK